MPNEALETARSIGSRYNGTVVAIGKFEGVHRGHQRILEELKRIATAENLGAVVLTFKNNPLSVLRPEACPEALMSPEQRAEALANRGVAEVLMLPFTRDLADITAEDFVKQYLAGALHVKHVIVGDDFRFGRGATGNPEMLRAAGAKYGFSVDVIDEVQDSEAGRISSTRIREALAEGDVELAETLLGHPHKMRGVVVRGDARGRELGVPTANLGPADGFETVEGMAPKEGVYAGFAEVPAGRFMAAISVGNNPTFTPEGETRVEAHLLDFTADLYTQPIVITFKYRLRGNMAFTTIEELIEVMQADITQARELLEPLK